MLKAHVKGKVEVDYAATLEFPEDTLKLTQAEFVELLHDKVRRDINAHINTSIDYRDIQFSFERSEF